MFFKFFIYLFVVFFMAGCIGSGDSHSVLYKPTLNNKVTPVLDHKLMVMDEGVRKKLIEESSEYRIKTKDKLTITVFEHPELSSMKSALPADKTIVNKNGTILLPKIGILHVRGKTIKELKDMITEKLKKILLNPDVTVSVAYPVKNRYFLVGEFKQTDVIEGDYNMKLLELIALGKGINIETADLRHSYVVRNNKKLPVNLYRLIEKGDLSQNINVINGDTVVIPNNMDQYVYVFARVAQSVTSKIPFNNGKLTLTEALSSARFLSSLHEITDLENVYVVRTEADRIETFELDAVDMFKGKTLPFNLVAGDIVYIPRTRAGNINTVINSLAPFLNNLEKSLSDINQFRNIIIHP